MNPETENIRLKKQIFNLNEQLADYKSELQEKVGRIGILEEENNKMKNETILVNRTNLLNTREIIKDEVERKLIDEKQRMIHLEKSLEEAQKNISILEIEKKNLDMTQLEIQRENQNLKKQLAEFGLKHQVTDFMAEIHLNRKDLAKREKDYQDIVLESNKLYDQMEDILSENRLLRELASVPKNFGINIEEIKLGDRKKIEDYEAKNRMLMGRIDELETERAQLVSSRLFLASSIQTKEKPFSLLNQEQKLVVAQYAQALYEGREFIVPERFELMKDKEHLLTKIEVLEKQLQGIQVDSMYKIYNVDNSKKLTNNLSQPNMSMIKENDNTKEILEILRRENEDLRKLVNTALGKFDKFDNINFESLRQNQQLGVHQSYQSNQSNHFKEPDEKLEFSYLQLPPKTIVEKNDYDNINTGFSYRFNSKIRIDPNQFYTLFGIAKNDQDIDALKEESAALQLQLIETVEIIDRMKSQDVFLNNNLNKLYNKYENLVLIQNELFERYIGDRNHFTKYNEEILKKNKDLLSEMSDLNRINKALEDTIKLIESKDLSRIEIRYLEKMKENSIIDLNLIKLTRKYECLYEDNGKLSKFVDDNEKNGAEKDKQMEDSIIKLKEWKQLLMFYLKLLTKKLKNSVDKSEYDRVLFENNFLREKQQEMVLKDIQSTKKLSNIDSLKVKFNELEQELIFAEETKLDSEIELNLLKKKMEDLDPQFQFQESLMRVLVQRLNELKLPFKDFKQLFDPDSTGKTNKRNFSSAIKTLQINWGDREIDLVISNILKDSENRIDTDYFIRKLSRYGVEEEKEEEKIITHFFDSIKSSGINLIDIFSTFDNDGNGRINRHEFKFALQNIQSKVKISDEVIDKILFIVCGNSEFEDLNYEQFCDLIYTKSNHIKNKRKRKDQISSKLKIDLKTNLLNKIVEAIKRNGLSYDQAFKYIDKDGMNGVSADELKSFLKKINSTISDVDLDNIWKLFDKDADGKIELHEFKSGLQECEDKIEMFKTMVVNKEDDLDISMTRDFGGTNNLNSTDIGNNPKDFLKIKHKLILLTEREKFFEYKISSYKSRYDILEKQNKDLTAQIEEYYNKHMKVADMYFTKSEEISNLKNIYATGITKEEHRKVENENDVLSREVTVLRAGLNTFKDLYKSAGRQIMAFNMKFARESDELNTYKNIIKDLQSEGNQQALIGKLYYSLLVSRWREAASIKKYDEFLNEFSTLREEHFKLENNNQALLKQASEYEIDLHDKIIENVKLFDENNQLNHPVITVQHLEELRQLIKDLLHEKNEITEKFVSVTKDNIKLKNEIDTMKGKVEYSEVLSIRLKIGNNDEKSKKMIELSDLLAKSKLNEAIIARENVFLKEREAYYEKLVEFTNNSAKNLEQQNIELESKNQKNEINFKKKDEERQKKFFQQLEGLKMYDFKYFADKKNQGSLTGQDNMISVHKENETLKKELSEYENKVKTLHDIISKKDNELKRLDTIYNEGDKLNPNNSQLSQFNSKNPQILNANQLDLINEDETRKFAQTAHKTIKTLQEMLNMKNTQINRKDQIIENLKNDSIKAKEYHMDKIQSLEEQINLENDTTMKKLSNVLENINPNVVVNISKNALSLMTLADIQKMVEEKDNTIKLLAIELQSKKDTLDLNYVKINDLNKKIIELNSDLFENENKKGIKTYLEEIKNLKMVIQEKSDLIDMEKDHIKKLREDYQNRLNERNKIEEQMLSNTVHVPNRLLENELRVENFNKVQEIRNKNKKIKEENDKLKKTIEELNKKIADLEKKVDELKNTNKLYFLTQDKDTKIISRLKTEKEEQKKALDKLKEDLDKTKVAQTQQQIIAPNVFVPRKVEEKVVKEKPKRLSSKTDIPKKSEEKKDEKVDEKPKEVEKIIETKEKPVEKKEDGPAVLKKLISYCVKRNIDMMKHLQRYDMTKLGKLTSSDFAKAIGELKLGIIEHDIITLLDWMKITENYVEIEYFIDLMIKTDPTYAPFIKNQEFVEPKKSKKYDPFENKNFNLNY